MPRMKYHVTPDTGRICVNLNKRELKEFKKMSIEFEMTLEEILRVAVDVFIKKYQDITSEEIDEKGVKSLYT